MITTKIKSKTLITYVVYSREKKYKNENKKHTNLLEQFTYLSKNNNSNYMQRKY